MSTTARRGRCAFRSGLSRPMSRASLNGAPVGEERSEGTAAGGGIRSDALGILEPHADDGCTHGHQQIADEAGLDRAVEDEENLLSSRRLWPGSAKGGDMRWRGEREIDGKGGAGSGHACHADAAAHLVDQALGDGEPETGAAA